MLRTFPRSLTTQMLEDIVRLYFKHQKPPGMSLVERGDYRLVHGGRGTIVEPGKWTYDLTAGHSVEMSMVLHRRDELEVKCPRCRAPFHGRVTNGWADWKVYSSHPARMITHSFHSSSCSGRFQVEAKHLDQNTLVSHAR
jgi:hypothetical protein